MMGSLKSDMRQRRSPALKQTLMHSIESQRDDIDKEKDKSTSNRHHVSKIKCMVVVVVLFLTFFFGLLCCVFYGHFVLCWLNVGMCTPLIDLITISYKLSRNESMVAIPHVELHESEHDGLCVMHPPEKNQSAEFKFVLLITYLDQFRGSNIFKILGENNGIHVAINHPTNIPLNFSGLYTKYIHWRKETDEVYIQSISVDDFKVFARDRNLYRFIRCHQIGIVWLLNFEDTDIELQSLLDDMTFYEYGGVRHAVLA